MKQIKSHRRRSNRVSVLLTAGAMGLAGAAVMSIPTVYADPIPTSGPTVRFDGGCLLGLGAASSSAPDQQQVSVPAGGVVTIVNEMNANGYVQMGAERVTVPKGGSRGFQVNAGPQDLKLVPQCTLDLIPNHKAVHITVTAPPPAPPQETRPGTPADDNKSTTPAKPGTPANGERPEAPPADPKARDGVPPGGDDAVPPADEPQPDATDDSQEAAPPATDGDDSRNAEAVQPLDSKPASNQSSSLLALIATVCLVGVAAAAIRAIVAHRSMRTAST